MLDESVPLQVRQALSAHDVATVTGLGRQGRENGDLLSVAEQSGFDALVIADNNPRHQQNLAGRRLVIVELWTNPRPTLERHGAYIAAALAELKPDAYLVLGEP